MRGQYARSVPHRGRTGTLAVPAPLEKRRVRIASAKVGLRRQSRSRSVVESGFSGDGQPYGGRTATTT